MNKSAYITTTLPYVNAEPHIGFALEIVQADAWARYQRLQGFDVIFNTGTDEHGLKIYERAVEEKKDPQTYTDEYAAKFNHLKDALNLSYTNFIRTTDKYHISATQTFWNICLEKGYIYKKNYKMRYCVGCELEKTDSELVDGRCPLHPKLEIKIIVEENYFFKFSAFQKKLLDFYEKNPNFVLPEFRFHEIKNFVRKGLEDFSVSRLKNKLPWGIEVPHDPDHVMYVWFDALINYISTLGWPEDENNFETYWPGVQVAGTDNLRQQSAMWQAMLMSVDLPPSKQIYIHGFITSDGKKMSKSLGNVVDPYSLVKKYGTDAVRYYLLSEIPSLDDGDFSYHRMEEIYNSDLANELGNLVSRLTTLGSKDGITVNKPAYDSNKYEKMYALFAFDKIFDDIWSQIKTLNKNIDEFTPWEKKAEERKQFLLNTLQVLNAIGFQLQPLLPGAAEKIMDATSGKIAKAPVLFPKI